MKKQILLTALTLALLASAVMTAAAEEVVATILFEPKKNEYGSYEYLLSTNPNNIVADKRMSMSYANVGYSIDYLPYYLVKGAKIVYENGGRTLSGITMDQPMRNTMGEYIEPKRMIAIITEDGIRIGIEELLPDTWAFNFSFLYQKFEREGRYR